MNSKGYKKIKLIGRGAFGKIYLIEDNKGQLKVVKKI